MPDDTTRSGSTRDLPPLEERPGDQTSGHRKPITGDAPPPSTEQEARRQRTAPPDATRSRGTKPLPRRRRR